MNCASIDIKAYFLGEADASLRRAAEEHMASCVACQEEHERLRLTEAALFTVREEEMPRRIAFVSDKVFAPRWYQRLWQCGPRLGFAGTAMLSCAILVHAFYQPVANSVPSAAPVVAVDIERQVKEEVARRLDTAIAQAVADVAARQEKRTAEIVAAAERRMAEQQRETIALAEAGFRELNKRVNYYTRQLQFASADLGGNQ